MSVPALFLGADLGRVSQLTILDLVSRQAKRTGAEIPVHAFKESQLVYSVRANQHLGTPTNRKPFPPV